MKEYVDGVVFKAAVYPYRGGIYICLSGAALRLQEGAFAPVTRFPRAIGARYLGWTGAVGGMGFGEALALTAEGHPSITPPVRVLLTPPW